MLKFLLPSANDSKNSSGQVVQCNKVLRIAFYLAYASMTSTSNTLENKLQELVINGVT